jgi:hypothetical protein
MRRVNNKTQARRPAYYIEIKLREKRFGYGSFMLFSHFTNFILNEQNLLNCDRIVIFNEHVCKNKYEKLNDVVI